MKFIILNICFYKLIFKVFRSKEKYMLLFECVIIE